jgi:hypothetical protein
MIQRRDGAGLPLEALIEFGPGSLDRDNAVEPRVAGLVHLTHAPGADGREDLVRAEFFAYG